MNVQVNEWLIFVITLLLASAGFDAVIELLNLRSSCAEMPEEFKDVYDPAYYASSAPEDPAGPLASKNPSYVGRGGGFKSTAEWLRTGARDDYEPESFKSSLGFRCAK